MRIAAVAMRLKSTLYCVPMFRRIGKWLVVFALVLTTGGHWAILQSAAWFGMFISFSRTSPVVVALEKTFDGRNPCQLCKAVEAGKQAEKKQEMQKLETKFDFWLVRSESRLFPPSLIPASFNLFQSARLRPEAPPTPPPRAA